jgi:CheY-like chemotaxis protein
MKILFIDDDLSVLLVTKLMIESLGYELILCDGGLAGIEALHKGDDIGLIFLDLMMPDINGIEVLRRIKASSQFKAIPVILQTGAISTDEIDEAYKLGIVGLLNKPYNKRDIKLMIEKFGSGREINQVNNMAK